MIIEGEVTEVNQDLLSFTINNTTRVYMVLLILDKPDQKLPVLNSAVNISSPIYKSDPFKVDIVVILPEGCTLIGDFSVEFPPNAFAQVARKHELKPTNFFIIDRNYELIKRGFAPSHNSRFTKEQLLVNIIHNVTIEKKLPDFDLMFISEIRNVDLTEDDYKDFDDHWTFGLHHTAKLNRVKFLFGYLYVHEKYGTVYLKDTKRSIQCIIENNSISLNLLKYMNKFVLIENPLVFTEVYNCQRGIFFEYLLIDFCKIKVLQVKTLNETAQPLIQKNFVTNPDYQFSEFVLITKFVPIVNSQLDVVCWLELEDRINKRKILLCLGKTYSSLFPILQENVLYKLHCPIQMWKRTDNNDRELKIAKPNLDQYDLPPNCIFQPIKSDLSSAKKFLTVNEALQELGNKSVINFKGILKVKKFITSLASKTTTILQDHNFGTPGLQTHLLEFHGENDGVLTLYLNDWDNRLVPLGLIPETLLFVSNVVEHEGRYYKSTALTIIRVIAYKPIFHFETVNLVGGIKNTNWGSSYVFDLGNFLPCFCIVSTIVVKFFIQNLKIFHQCKTCLDQVNYNEICLRCRCDNSELTATILLQVDCINGLATVKAEGKKGMDLIKLFLGLPEEKFNEWCNVLRSLNSFEFSPDLEENKQSGVTETLFIFFNVLNKYGMSLEIKCKKIGEQDDKLLYTLLQARMLKNIQFPCSN